MAPYFHDPNRARELTPFRITGRTQQEVWASLGDYDLRPRLPTLRGIPSLVLHGEQDLIPLETARITAELTGAETRVTVLGHVQRGGAPGARDRLLASAFGVHAVDLLAAGKSDRMVAWQNRDVVDVPLAEAIAKPQVVDPAGPLVRTARGFRVSMTDVSDTIAALSLQGPTSRDVLDAVTGGAVAKLRFFRLTPAKIGGADLSEHPHEASRRGAAHEGVVDDHHALAVDDVAHGVVLHPGPEVPVLLLRLDERPAHVVVA